jgi:hypothetical protein
LSKSLDTLVNDILRVVEGKGGWDKSVTEFLSSSISSVAEARFSQEQKPRDYLSLSAIGSPCDRKLWYKLNQSEDAEAVGARIGSHVLLVGSVHDKNSVGKCVRVIGVQ